MSASGNRNAILGANSGADRGQNAQGRAHLECGADLVLGCGQGTAVRLEERVILGRIRGAHGVRGLLRAQPFTENRDTLLGFTEWMLGAGGEWREVKLISGHAHGNELLVKMVGVENRDEAQQLRGSEIAVWRSQLPVLDEEEFYWSDLEGLKVVTCDGFELGVVERVFATGANDVLVVSGEHERLIPFLPGDVVKQVDLQAERIEVDWDPEF
ncbi:MAG: 16S rRNA processing protein RimM [Gammaproteobacteria bacterium]|jgi:16S rRNA processing protein RimM